MRRDDLEHVPTTQNLIVMQGPEYERAFATTPLCCPSQAFILRSTWYRKTGSGQAAPSAVQTGYHFLSRSSP